LIGLAHEKPYGSIAVKEILDRANVGRSTFYTHFRDKDELLESGIHEILRSIHGRSCSGTPIDRVVAFSLPILEHIDEHRRAGPPMKREGRILMHERLQHVLTHLIADDLARGASSRQSLSPIPPSLVARHVAATFVRVLGWWVESKEALTPADVDARFRALVVPALTAFNSI